MKTGREWLEAADWSEPHNEEQLATLREKVGYDRAEEVQAALTRVSTNLLDILGDMRMSDQSLVLLQRAVASIVVDNYFPIERDE